MKLQDWVIEKGLTAADVAEKLGTSNIAVGRYLRGERMPHAGIVERIISLTGGAVTAQDLHETRMDYLRQIGAAA